MATQRTDLDEVLERVTNLEKENRRLKQIGIAALIAACSLVVMGQASQRKTIEANEFILKDTSGNVRARLSVNDKNMGASLSLIERNGDLDLMLSAKDSVGGNLILSEGKESLLLTASQADFVHSEGEKTSLLKGQLSSNALFLSDGEGFATHIGATELTMPSVGETRKRSAASIVLVDKEKHVIWQAP
jgi:hypothetical protein